MSMTWGTLGKLIEKMTPDQRDQDVTVFLSGPGEYVPADELRHADPEETTVLDPGHPFLDLEGA